MHLKGRGKVERTTLAFDADGNRYFPVMCVYEKTWPKVFVVNETMAGTALLMAAGNIAKEVTGGGVQTCGYFAFNPRD